MDFFFTILRMKDEGRWSLEILTQRTLSLRLLSEQPRTNNHFTTVCNNSASPGSMCPVPGTAWEMWKIRPHNSFARCVLSRKICSARGYKNELIESHFIQSLSNHSYVNALSPVSFYKFYMFCIPSLFSSRLTLCLVCSSTLYSSDLVTVTGGCPRLVRMSSALGLVSGSGLTIELRRLLRSSE